MKIVKYVAHRVWTKKFLMSMKGLTLCTAFVFGLSFFWQNFTWLLGILVLYMAIEDWVRDGKVRMYYSFAPWKDQVELGLITRMGTGSILVLMLIITLGFGSVFLSVIPINQTSPYAVCQYFLGLMLIWMLSVLSLRYPVRRQSG